MCVVGLSVACYDNEQECETTITMLLCHQVFERAAMFKQELVTYLMDYMLTLQVTRVHDVHSMIAQKWIRPVL